MPSTSSPRLRLALPALVTSVVSFVLACAQDPGLDPRRDGSGTVVDTPPVALLIVSPTNGAVPLAVNLDASGSHDDRDTASTLIARFDLDGDGTFDTEAAANLVHAFTYALPGTYTPRVEITDSAGQTTIGSGDTVTVEPSDALIANLDVDANRDGAITVGDDLDEHVYGPHRGAIFLSNLDDDDGDGTRDARDDEVNGSLDTIDLAPIVLRQIPALPDDVSAELEISPDTAQPRVALLDQESGVSLLDADGHGSLDASRLRAGDVLLGIESVSGRTATWDGVVTVRFVLRSAGQVVSEDTVSLRVAPTIFTADTQRAHRLYVMDIPTGAGNNAAMIEVMEQTLPEGVELYDVDDDTYAEDRWVQDNMQLGFQMMPGASAPIVRRHHLQTERPTGMWGLEAFLPYELLGADLAFTFPGGRETSLNYGGNIEVAPPHAGYPMGRMLVGGGALGTLGGRDYDDTMAREQRTWIDAQEIQAPAVEVSSEWLAVGHIDEIFMAVPLRNAPEGTRPWKVIVASPTLARQALVDLQNDGKGDLVVFAGRDSETTVDAILADDELMLFNQRAAARIDTIRADLSEALNLGPTDFLEVPVLYEEYRYGGYDYAAAYNPGIQNLVIVEEILYIPDPEGPDAGSGDVWKNLVDAALAETGHTLHYVDVFESYHELMGEAHCGTNVEREPYATPFWSVEGVTP